MKRTAHNSKRGYRKLTFQHLEPRMMMAGDVTVSVVNGDLRITGDSSGNEVAVFQTITQGRLVPGSFFVNGINGTTINHGAGRTFTGVTRDFVIDLAGGNDKLTLGQNGNDNTFKVPNDLTVRMGDGANTVAIQGITVTDDASITTGAGKDIIAVRGAIGAPNVDAGHNNLSIQSGNADDVVMVRHSVVRGDLVIDTGADSGRDAVDFFQASLGGNAIINTGSGDDSVSIDQVSFNKDLNINTGAGRDVVEINSSDADRFFLALGEDADALRLRDTFGRRASFNGNGGADTISEIDTQFTELHQVLSF